ncbi:MULTISPECIES: MFS transporter [unclassified Leclercia]|uniref:MFS transporter n=1 Tax=Leclercia barmai TaxID=2785629 RepID=A0ABS7RYW5_9ENTR|nr:MULTISPECIES: MFS transporter [unclassified Leclercia]MBZ0058985.1 MFS transporter [Leclercia sp. EMC7]MCM5697021.1 MFS transporter [Leclercia sp. LTM01]MCM5701149.1 MFS transporter [Leclercia sp. LTM14]
MKLSIKEKIGFGSGDMAIAIVMMSMAMIITYFYTDVYGLAPGDLGILLIAVRFIDAVIDPLIGVMTDKTHTRWGRYRPYLLFFALPFGITIWMMFTTPNFDYTGKLLWAWGSYIALTLTYTFISIPYVSLIGVITDDPKERLSANSYRFVMTKIAMFLVTIIVPMAALYLGQNDLASGYQLAMGSMGVVSTLLCICCFFSVKERVIHKTGPIHLSSQLKNLLKNDQWIILGITIALIMFGGIVRNSVAAYYAKYYLHGGNDLISPFLTTSVVASVLAMLLAGPISRRFDKIKMFRYTQLLAFIVGVAMYFMVGEKDIYLAFFFFFILTLLSDMQLPVYWASIAEAVDYGEVKTGTRVSGLAFGGILFFQKLGMGLAGGFIGFCLSHFGYKADVEQSQSSLLGITLMMTLIPAVFNLIVGLYMKKYIINDDYYDGIKQQLTTESVA